MSNAKDASVNLPAVPEDPRALSDAQWRAMLSDLEYRILRHAATERPGTGRYLDLDTNDRGAFHCVGCGNKLYDAAHKFHSGCGWPSFFSQVEPDAITTHEDDTHGMCRTEMRCARCGGHLGHIFNDAPHTPTGLRHCVNGYALIHVPEGQRVEDVLAEHRKAAR